MQPMQISGIGFDLSQAPGGSILDAGVRVARSAKEVIDFCNLEDAIAPALAMYSPSKRVLFCDRFVKAQQEGWLAGLSVASRIYVIGLRVHAVDTHIWEPLAKATAPLHYVGREPDEFLNWARSKSRKAAYVMADSFEASIPAIAKHLGYRAMSP